MILRASSNGFPFLFRKPFYCSKSCHILAYMVLGTRLSCKLLSSCVHYCFLPLTCPHNHNLPIPPPRVLLSRGILINLSSAPYLPVFFLTFDLELGVSLPSWLSDFFAAFLPSLTSRSLLPQLILSFIRLSSSFHVLEMCSKLSSTKFSLLSAFIILFLHSFLLESLLSNHLCLTAF